MYCMYPSLLQLQVSPVVSKAGNLLQSRINELALCIAYPDSVQKSGLSLSRAEKKDQKVVESSLRFSTKECGYPSLEVTDVSFSVNQPVLLHGVTLYGGTDASYKYKVVLYHQADPPKSLAETEGTFSQSDYYGESFVNVKFKRPIKLEVRGRGGWWSTHTFTTSTCTNKLLHNKMVNFLYSSFYSKYLLLHVLP